uniref:Uncharacterized protein n=1 Tax=Oryza sativa subsp. japonica TaxID=39947 RepID=Q7XIM2_ORYSJ|nr:hypothetical protein [Oryza sativa Japonica Group]
MKKYIYLQLEQVMQAVRGVDLGDDGKDAVVRLVQVHPHHAQLLAVAVAPHEPAGPAAARAAEDDSLRLLDPRVHLPGEHRPDLRRHRRRLRQRRRRASRRHSSLFRRVLAALQHSSATTITGNTRTMAAGKLFGSHAAGGAPPPSKPAMDGCLLPEVDGNNLPPAIYAYSYVLR